MTEISATDLKGMRDAGERLMLLDVREPSEIATAAVPGSTAIRMADVPQHLAELPSDRRIVVMCHHGGRSAQVTQFLNANGFPNAVNLDGGIDAWALEVDPTTPRY